jgi:hypothetical protein
VNEWKIKEREGKRVREKERGSEGESRRRVRVICGMQEMGEGKNECKREGGGVRE